MDLVVLSARFMGKPGGRLRMNQIAKATANSSDMPPIVPPIIGATEEDLEDT